MKKILKIIIKDLAENIALNSDKIGEHYTLFLKAADLCNKNNVALNRKLLKPYANKLFLLALYNQSIESCDQIISFDKQFDYYTESDFLKYFKKHTDASRAIFEKNDNFHAMAAHFMEKFKDTYNIDIIYLLNSLSSPDVAFTKNLNAATLLKFISSDKNRFLVVSIETFYKVLSNIELDENLLDAINVCYGSEILSSSNEAYSECIRQLLDKTHSLWEKQKITKNIITNKQSSLQKL